MRCIFFAVVILWSSVLLASEEADAIYNEGQRLQNLGMHKESLVKFQEVLKRVPDDWGARIKVIQQQHAMDMTQEAEMNISELYGMRKEIKFSQLAQEPLFVRDQFSVRDNKVIAMEYYELSGSRPVKLSFNVLDDTGKKTSYKISLGSYPYMTESAGKRGIIKQGERLFHLDGYYPDGSHKTFAFFTSQPSYWNVKEQVKQIIMGECEAISSMTVKSNGAIELGLPGNEEKSILEAITLFEEDPLRREIPMIMALITQFAMKSPDVNVVITMDLLPWLNADPNPDPSNILLASYVAGNIRPQLEKKVNNNHSVEGIKFLLKIYAALKEKGKIPKIEHLEQWKELNEKELAGTIEKLIKDDK